MRIFGQDVYPYPQLATFDIDYKFISIRIESLGLTEFRHKSSEFVLIEISK